MNEDIKKMTFKELIDYMTGHSLMAIGRGESFREVIRTAIYASNEWTIANEAKKKENKS